MNKNIKFNAWVFSLVIILLFIPFFCFSQLKSEKYLGFRNQNPLLCLLASHPINQKSGLTPDQERKYNLSRLSFDIERKGIGSYGQGTINYASWHKWTAYRGFNRISETKFFEITGYEQQAKRAKSHRLKGNIFGWGGIALSIAGVIGISKGGGLPPLIGTCIGLVSTYVGIGYKLTNSTPYGTVQNIADEYNKKLYLQIKKNF